MEAHAELTRTQILGLPLPRLTEALEPWVDRPFRARQVFTNIHHRRVASFAEMTDLSRPLREKLTERFEFSLPEIESRLIAEDGTVKYLLRLADGASIETVDMGDDQRRTLCISSQAGCGMACGFCVTGYWGAGRNLTASEMVGQVQLLRRIADLPAALNLVFMGMGEPLVNLEPLRDALEVLYETISPRRITLSTSGVVTGIDQIGQWPKRPNLAISLHAPDDARRSELMPINRVWPIADLVGALRRFPLEARRRITIEYLVLADFNDSLADADRLSKLLRGVPVKINLIPFNPDPVLPSWMKRPEDPVVDRFRARLEGHGYTATVRRRRGHDVAAACGQLRAHSRPPRGRPEVLKGSSSRSLPPERR